MIVEDEKNLVTSLKKLLVSEGFEVDVCLNGQEGYEQASVEEYDLIVLDLGLPGMDGLDVSRELRKEGIKIPILMLTARDSVKNKIEGLNTGADDYLVKPFEFEELLARIRALIRRSSREPGIELSCGTLTLDTLGHVVKRNGKILDLSAREYSLLEYLMFNSTHILSKQKILEHVWGSEVDPFSNVVDVYIGYLRAKIDKAFPKEPVLIHTVKGLGYKIGEV